LSIVLIEYKCLDAQEQTRKRMVLGSHDDSKLQSKMIGFHSQDLNRILRVDIKLFVVVNINA